MEDKLKMEDKLIFFLRKWKMTSHFLQMEDDLFFLMEDTSFFLMEDLSLAQLS